MKQQKNTSRGRQVGYRTYLILATTVYILWGFFFNLNAENWMSWIAQNWIQNRFKATKNILLRFITIALFLRPEDCIAQNNS